MRTNTQRACRERRKPFRIVLRRLYTERLTAFTTNQLGLVLIILLAITSCSVQSSYLQPWHTRQIKTIYVKPFTTELDGETEIVNQLTESAMRCLRSINRFQLVRTESTADAIFTGELIDKHSRYIIFNYWLIKKDNSIIGENSGYILITQIDKHFKSMRKLIK